MSDDRAMALFFRQRYAQDRLQAAPVKSGPGEELKNGEVEKLDIDKPNGADEPRNLGLVSEAD